MIKSSLFTGLVKSYSCSSMQFRHWPLAGPLKAPPLCCGCINVTLSKHFGKPGGHGAALGEQRGETFDVFGNVRHEFFCRGLIFKTFVHVVQKPASEYRMLEKFPTGSRCGYSFFVNMAA